MKNTYYAEVLGISGNPDYESESKEDATEHFKRRFGERLLIVYYWGEIGDSPTIVYDSGS